MVGIFFLMFFLLLLFASCQRAGDPCHSLFDLATSDCIPDNRCPKNKPLRDAVALKDCFELKHGDTEWHEWVLMIFLSYCTYRIMRVPTRIEREDNLRTYDDTLDDRLLSDRKRSGSQSVRRI